MESILQFVERFVDALPGLVNAGKNIADLVANFQSRFSDMKTNMRAPTAEEWDWLNNTLDPMERDLQQD